MCVLLPIYLFIMVKLLPCLIGTQILRSLFFALSPWLIICLLTIIICVHIDGCTYITYKSTTTMIKTKLQDIAHIVFMIYLTAFYLLFSCILSIMCEK